MDTINDEGWIKLHRKILDNSIFKDAEALQLFLYCLLRANYKPNDFLFNNQLIHLERGQFIFGLRKANKALKMSIRKLRTRLLILQKLGILTHQTTHRFSIISVCNYNLYQDTENEKGHSKRHRDDTATTTNKKDKNIKNKDGVSGKKIPDTRVKDFFNYWSETFTQETGQPYTFSYAKEGKLIKQLLQVHPLDTLQDAVKAFFKDEQCRRRGLTIGIFFLEINRLVSLKSMNPIEQAKREMAKRSETREAIARATPKTFQGSPFDRVEEILRDGGLDEVHN